MSLTEGLSLFNQISMWVAEWIIVVVLIDDIYGFKEMKKAIKKYGKMRSRRFHRQFLRTSKKYFRKHNKNGTPPEEGNYSL